MNTIRERLKTLGKTQVWLIRQLRAEGYVVQPPELSSMLSGVLSHPKAIKVLECADSILTAEESHAQ